MRKKDSFPELADMKKLLTSFIPQQQDHFPCAFSCLWGGSTCLLAGYASVHARLLGEHLLRVVSLPESQGVLGDGF